MKVTTLCLVIRQTIEPRKVKYGRSIRHKVIRSISYKEVVSFVNDSIFEKERFWVTVQEDAEDARAFLKPTYPLPTHNTLERKTRKTGPLQSEKRVQKSKFSDVKSVNK